MEQCPYCGIDLMVETQEEAEAFAAPYQQVEQESSNNELPSGIPQAPYSSSGLSAMDFAISDEEWEGAPSATTAAATIVEKQESAKTVVMALLLLGSGSMFFLFSIVLLLFSQDGVLTLRWNSDYWPLYLGPACIALSYGWYTLNKIDDTV
jgi:hypothetical protein